MKRRTVHIIGGALLLLFLGYLGTIIAYTHFNFIGGVLVSHAHKRTEEQKQNPFHQHTATEAIMLQQIADYSTMGALTLASVLPSPYFCIIKREIWECPLKTSSVFHPVFRRGPPVMVL